MLLWGTRSRKSHVRLTSARLPHRERADLDFQTSIQYNNPVNPQKKRRPIGASHPQAKPHKANNSKNNNTMICTRCLTRLSRRTTTIPTTTTATATATATLARRPYSTPTTTETSTTATPRSASGSPSATSKPAVAQPFSTPLTPAGSKTTSSKPTTSAPKIQSSVPAGTVLKGLNFYKDKQDPVAMSDEEYPAWLWGVLDKSSGGKGAEGAGVDEGDLYGEFLFLKFSFLRFDGFLGLGGAGLVWSRFA